MYANEGLADRAVATITRLAHKVTRAATLILLGSVGATYGDARWIFAAGAMLASVVWFFALAYGARLLGRVLASPRAWRILDGVIAVVMLAIAVSLVLPA